MQKYLLLFISVVYAKSVELVMLQVIEINWNQYCTLLHLFGLGLIHKYFSDEFSEDLEFY